MKVPAVSVLVGLFVLLTSSCTNYYGNEPEGYVTQTVPLGYTVAVVAGISYWHNHGHYYRYWPGYGYVVVRPPYGRPPYQRPPARPPGKPVHPIERPPGGGRPPQGKPPQNKPVQLPSTRPVTRPSTPTTRPSAPTTRPSMPSTRPSSPSMQPRSGGGFGGSGAAGGGGRSKKR